MTKALPRLVATVYFLVDEFLRWVGQALLIRSQESDPAERLRVSELLLGIGMFVDYNGVVIEIDTFEGALLLLDQH